MSDQQPRYAIYFVPAIESRIYRFGAALLGYDSLTGHEVAQPEAINGAIPGWHALTDDPRKYGFHATLKAPFRLADGKDEDALVKAFDAFTNAPRAVPTITPVVQLLRFFVAIVNDAPNAELAALVDACVSEFESFRAPLSEHDRARRLKSPLTPNQVALLDRWGYPYVFEEFFFHMSLTAKIAGEARDRVRDHLAAEFTALGITSLAINHLALLKQPEPSARFVAIRHRQLQPKS